MRKAALAAAVAAVLVSAPGSAYANKDTACEAYALASMRQIEKSEKYKGCAARGLFKGDRWRKDFSYHFNNCASRYDSATKAHQPFTQGEKNARNNALKLCVSQTF
jgi:hypothetical protein